jgi:FecR protein
MKSNSSGNRILAMLFSLAGILFFLSPALKAQDAPDATAKMAANDTQDPPSLVARISYLYGSVSMQPGGTGDWGSAALNRPVTIGDKIWTDQNSRAELQAGQASLHLGGMTALSFLNLNDNITQMRLAEGQLNFRVREMRQGDVYEVDTPNLAFTVREAGAFRISVNENGDATSVTVIRGQGEIAAGGQTYPVNTGQRAEASGPDGNVQVQLAAAAQPDELDQWSQQRDLKEDNAVSAKYVNRDTVGYSDLDDYGTWKEEPTYGSVWVPNNVPVGWAPYSNGYWNWVNPWGWTWVDYAPWGFAPYHYGRWNYFGGYWGWCPGPIYARPFYGPAFVGFVGGFGFGVGFGWGGGVGWFPLGWGEPFHPWYHCGPHYWHNVNVHNTYIRNVNVINNHNYNYAYAHNPRAVTATTRSNFANGQSIHGNRMAVNEAALRGAHVTNGAGVSPSRSSYFGAASVHGRVAIPSVSIQNRSVVARTAPAAGAAHLPARTMNAGGFTQGHFANASAVGSVRADGASQGMNSNRAVFNRSSATSMTRQGQISANRPPSAMQGLRPNASSTQNGARPNSAAPRSWNAQGNVTDSGHGPQGFGTKRPSNTPQSVHVNTNRPPWAHSNSTGINSGVDQHNTIDRPPATYHRDRADAPPAYNGNRGNAAPRSYKPPSYNTNRGASAPRSYSPPSYNGNRGYSAPRSYSSAPRGYSAPSYSAPRGSGGGAPHSSSAPNAHGGGGGGGHPHR